MTKIYKHPESPDEIYGLDRIYYLNIDKAWYWYKTEPYAGHGTILMKRGNLWSIDDLGHCSCNGPADNISFDGVLLKDLKIKHSAELMGNAGKLLKMARKS